MRTFDVVCIMGIDAFDGYRIKDVKVVERDLHISLQRNSFFVGVG